MFRPEGRRPRRRSAGVWRSAWGVSASASGRRFFEISARSFLPPMPQGRDALEDELDRPPCPPRTRRSRRNRATSRSAGPAREDPRPRARGRARASASRPRRWMPVTPRSAIPTSRSRPRPAAAAIVQRPLGAAGTASFRLVGEKKEQGSAARRRGRHAPPRRRRRAPWVDAKQLAHAVVSSRPAPGRRTRRRADRFHGGSFDG